MNSQFWKTEPFEDPLYLAAQLPFTVGSITKKTSEALNAILPKLAPFSEQYLASIAQGKIESGVPSVFRAACQQMVDADFYLYGIPSQWRFDVKIDYVSAHSVHIPDYFHGIDVYHRDGDPQKPRSINNPGRRYATTNIYPTRFENGALFKPWQIIHFIGEKHISPHVPKKCLRIFLRGVAIAA